MVPALYRAGGTIGRSHTLGQILRTTKPTCTHLGGPFVQVVRPSYAWFTQAGVDTGASFVKQRQ